MLCYFGRMAIIEKNYRVDQVLNLFDATTQLALSVGKSTTN